MYDKNFRKHFNFANCLTRKVREIKMHALYSNMNPQMVQDPTLFSLWQNNTNRGKDMSSTTVWFF